MILVAGLSPAWQRIQVFDDFSPGEVNRASETLSCASGKVLNVAIGLRCLGAPIRCLAPVGGSPSRFIHDEFEELEIDADWIETQTPTRTCCTILDRSTGEATELVENALPISGQELQEWIHNFQQASNQSDWLVLTGSLPPNAPRTLFADLLEATCKPSILDVRRDELIAALPHRPLLVKPNREELQQTVQRSLNSEGDVIEAARELQNLGATWVLISDGPRPMIAVGPECSLRFEIPPVTPIVNPIGCGDSLTAGIAAGLSEQHDVPESIRWGIACARQNLTQLLPARLNRERMLEMAADIPMSEIKT